jgi:ATP/maltotriose-dependent transcriptional regulator MalT
MPDAEVANGSELIEAGRSALHQSDWAGARHAFEAAIAEQETAEACEGLAEACFLLHDEQATLAARERAFQLYRERGDRASAARIAIWLANDLIEFRGAGAVANGWVQRAHRLLEGLDPAPEHAWMALWDAASVLMGENDATLARDGARRAVAMAREMGVLDVEMCGLAIEGLARVTAGDIDAGMRLLDEAASAAVSGEVEHPSIRGTILCSLMDACDRVRDFDRATQWCERIHDVSQRWGMEGVFSMCRPHYAVVLTWRGAWDEAEAELNAAVRELSAIRPPMAIEGIIRLAELRVLQGRYEDAATLFGQAEHEPLSQLGRARLALVQGDPTMAVELAERFLRRIPSEDRIERAVGLEIMVRACVAAGQPDAGADAASELRAIASAVRTPGLRAAACSSDGVLASSRGDHEAARHAFEEAADAYAAAGAPFETARTRLDLAEELRAGGLASSALREIEAALATFIELGAAGEAARARAMMAVLVAADVPPSASHSEVAPSGLTEREVEVLRLIASGLSNRAIADELVLSVRTVERHISNLYSKIGVDGRTARAAVTAHAFRLGLVQTTD